MKKIFKIVGVVFGVMFIASIIWGIQIKKQMESGELIEVDGRWVTNQEWKEIMGLDYYEGPAKNTPEEVYTTFRQSLLDGDYEVALGYIAEKNKEEYREAFEDREKLEEWIFKLPENITKETEYDTAVTYDLDMGTGNKNNITFVKNKDGYWEIERI